MSTPKEVKVGAFVLAGLTVIGLVVFLIGEQQQLFAKKLVFETVFEDVQGLQRGSPVRMGGLDIGAVLKVEYSDDPKDRQIHVQISVVAEESQRIRRDSVAQVGAKGLLGDKMVVISAGSMTQPEVPPGGRIQSEESEDMSRMMGRLGSISSGVEKVVNNLEHTTSAFADNKLHEDLKATLSSLRGVMESLDHGQGYLGKLLRDRQESERLSRVVVNVEQLTEELDRTASHLNASLERINSGPGFAHELVYGRDGSQALTRVGNAAQEIETTLRGVREGNGVAKSLLYGDPTSRDMLANLNALSRELKELVSDARAGKGTLGALLVDPSVYEDLKALLGNVERNRTLRALVRYSIRKDEAAPAEVKDSESAAPKPGNAARPEAGKPQIFGR